MNKESVLWRCHVLWRHLDLVIDHESLGQGARDVPSVNVWVAFRIQPGCDSMIAVVQRDRTRSVMGLGVHDSQLSQKPRRANALRVAVA